MSPAHHVLTHVGYGAVFLAVALESIGFPIPGETALIAAAIYAGTTYNLSIALIIATAAAGAIVGGTIGCWLGREFGFRLLLRFGSKIGMHERRIRLGQYLFMKYGGEVVFFGRFVPVLRALAAFLAGTNHMTWPRFLIFNAAGAIVWAALYGVGAYFLGKHIRNLAGPVGAAIGVIAAIVIVVWVIFIRRNEKRLEEEAERAIPGPIRPSH
jgi:membrane protein DedA with SNARE-associated domain